MWKQLIAPSTRYSKSLIVLKIDWTGTFMWATPALKLIFSYSFRARRLRVCMRIGFYPALFTQFDFGLSCCTSVLHWHRPTMTLSSKSTAWTVTHPLQTTNMVQWLKNRWGLFKWPLRELTDRRLPRFRKKSSNCIQKHQKHQDTRQFGAVSAKLHTWCVFLQA